MEPFAEPGTSFFGDSKTLKSELTTLRANENRLDALLDGGGKGAVKALNQSGILTGLPTVQDYVEREEELKRVMKPKRVAGVGKLDLGPFTTLTMEIIIRAWSETGHKLSLWRRSRREEACERFLSRRVTAKAIRYLLGGLTYELECPMSKEVARGAKVKDLVSGNVGTFLSATPKGICKIQWSPTDVSLRPMSMLAWLKIWPHPAYAGLFFLAWARILIVREKQKVAKFRAKIAGTKDEGRTSNMLVWLSVQSEEASSIIRIMFESWAKISAERRSNNKDLLADVWMAWRHGALNNRHSRAVTDLESTSGELRQARMALMRQTQRFDRLERKLMKIDDMQSGLFLSYVLSSWHYAVEMGKMRLAVSMAGREERLKLAENLSGKMSGQLMGRMLPAIFTAWHHRIKTQNQAGKQQALLSTAFTQASLSVAFHEWKYLVTGHHQEGADREVTDLRQKLVDKDEAFNKLQDITEQLYGFGREADRLKFYNAMHWSYEVNRTVHM
jgi:hypothetical protein